MLTTSRSEWAERARYLTTQAKDDPIEYVHNAVGYNYRLTNVQAALGVAQLEQLEGFVTRKRAIAERYRDHFDSLPGIVMAKQADWADATHWLVNIEVDKSETSGDSRGLLKYLHAEGVQTRPLWRPVHLQKPYENCQTLGGAVAEQIHQVGLSLPSSVDLTDAQVDTVAAAITQWSRGTV